MSIDTDTDISKFDGNLILVASPKNKFQNIAEIKRQFRHILFTQKCAKRIRQTLNNILKSPPICKKIQHYLMEHACI